MSVLAISILCVSHLAVSNSLWLLWIAAYQVPLSWNSPGKNTRVRSHFLLQGIFLTQGSHAVSRIAGQLFTSWATTEAPIILEWIATELGSHSLLESTKNDSKFKTRTYGQAPSQIPYSCFPLSSVAQSLPTLCNPKDFNMPDFPVHRQLPVCSHSCPSSWWCHPTISSVVPFSSCPQSFPASGSFPVSQFFTSGGQNIGVSASTSVLPMNIQDWFPLGWTGRISLQSKGLSSLFQHHTSKTEILWCSVFFTVQLSHPSITTGKTKPLTRQTFVGKVMSLLFNTLSWLVIAFLLRSKCLFLSWLQSPSAVILEAKKKKKSLSLFPLFPYLFAMRWWDWMPWS